MIFSCAENVFADRAVSNVSSSSLAIAYLCLDWVRIFSLVSTESSGVGSGIVCILNGSDVIPSIMSLTYPLNLGKEMKSLADNIHLNCELMTSASSCHRVKEMIVPTLPKIASLMSGSN